MAIAAHELRTPLSPLKLQLQLLHTCISRESAGGSAEKAKQQVLRQFASADRQVDRLIHLVSDLMEVSQLDRQVKLELSSFDMGELAREVIERFRVSGDVTVPIRLDVPGPVLGSWDRERMERVIENLVSNAIKYGASKPVDVAVVEDRGRVRVTVRDYGIGISEKYQNQIFDRFVRAISLKQYGGLGLGLYIAREIVRAHGGVIDVVSRLGGGATFTVELPIRVEIPDARLASPVR
jgi:signal transduction histidine kinase